MILVAGVVLWGRYLVLRSVADPFPPLGAKILWDIPRIWTVAGSWTHVVRLLVFPLDLSVDYGPAVIPIEFGWGYANSLGAVLVLGFLAMSVFAWRRGLLGRERNELPDPGMGGRLDGHHPFSHLQPPLPERDPAFGTYPLPTLGGLRGRGGLGVPQTLGGRPQLAPVVLLLYLGFGIGRSWTRTPVWESNLTLLPVLVADHPEAGRSQWLLGDSYFTIGKFSEGLRAYRLAAGILGRSLQLHGGSLPEPHCPRIRPTCGGHAQASLGTEA